MSTKLTVLIALIRTVTFIMPSQLYRTASSTVVLLNDDSLLEVRRGSETGARIKDPRTWTSQEAWLTAVGEPLVPDEPLSADIKLVESLYRKYRHWAGESGLQMTGENQIEQKELASNVAELSTALKRLGSVISQPSGLYRISNKHMDLVDGKPSDNPWATTAVSAEEYMRYKAGLEALLSSALKKFEESSKKQKEAFAAGRFQGYFKPFGNPSLYVSCDDGAIRPVYYNVAHKVCGVPQENHRDFLVGRSFADLNIRPIAWYARGPVTDVLKKIKDLP